MRRVRMAARNFSTLRGCRSARHRFSSTGMGALRRRGLGKGQVGCGGLFVAEPSVWRGGGTAMTGGGRRGGGGVEPPRDGASLAASHQAWGRSGSARLVEAPTQASTVAPSLPSRSSSSSWQPPFQEKGRRLGSKLRIAQSHRGPSYRRSRIFRRVLHVDGAVTSPLLQSTRSSWVGRGKFAVPAGSTETW